MNNTIDTEITLTRQLQSDIKSFRVKVNNHLGNFSLIQLMSEGAGFVQVVNQLTDEFEGLRRRALDVLDFSRFATTDIDMTTFCQDIDDLTDSYNSIFGMECPMNDNLRAISYLMTGIHQLEQITFNLDQDNIDFISFLSQGQMVSLNQCYPNDAFTVQVNSNTENDIIESIVNHIIKVNKK